MKNIKTIEKDGLILSEDGKIVMGVSDDFITNVVIPEGVEEIGEQAFSGCCSIKMVTFPSSLKKIGFASLAGISSCYLSIPEGVEVIENAAFFNATISCVSLPSTLKVLENAFVGCIIKNLFINVRDLNNLKFCGQNKNIYSEEPPRLSIAYPQMTKVYVPSDLVESYKNHPVFGRFEHIEPIIQANNDDLLNQELRRYFIQDFFGRKYIWQIPFVMENNNWYIDDPIRIYLHDELKVTRGLDTLCEAFSYDGVHAEMKFTISDELDDLGDEPGCLAECRKASASSGAEYYMKLDCMKKHEGLFWLTPEILFAIAKFPKYMKIMPQKLDNSQLEGIGVPFR